MRWLGILLIGISLCAVGFWQTSRLSARRRELDRLTGLIRLIEERIRLGRPEAERIMRELHAQERWPLLSALVRFLDEGNEFPESFALAVSEYEKNSSLEKQDLARLLEFGSLLGSGDLEGELSRCGIYEEYFSHRTGEAEEEMKKKAPLYQTLWCCFGILASVLLL